MSRKRVERPKEEALEVMFFKDLVERTSERAHEMLEESLHLENAVDEVKFAINEFEAMISHIESGESVGDKLDMIDCNIDEEFNYIDVLVHAPMLMAYIQEFFEEYEDSFTKIYKSHKIDWSPRRQILYALHMVRSDYKMDTLIKNFKDEVEKDSIHNDDIVRKAKALNAIVRAAEKLWNKQKYEV